MRRRKPDALRAAHGGYLNDKDDKVISIRPRPPRRWNTSRPTDNKTVPVAIVSEFVDGDIYRWGSLMAGALVGSLPLIILYSFFVEHYVSAMTGAVKE